jgi:hypothetical protein
MVGDRISKNPRWRGGSFYPFGVEDSSFPGNLARVADRSIPAGRVRVSVIWLEQGEVDRAKGGGDAATEGPSAARAGALLRRPAE